MKMDTGTQQMLEEDPPPLSEEERRIVWKKLENKISVKLLLLLLKSKDFHKVLQN